MSTEFGRNTSAIFYDMPMERYQQLEKEINIKDQTRSKIKLDSRPTH